jgi:hypothetical protein
MTRAELSSIVMVCFIQMVFLNTSHTLWVFYFYFPLTLSFTVLAEGSQVIHIAQEAITARIGDGTVCL